MFLADCHTHSSCSFDADFPMVAMAKTAYEYGLTSLTLTDHCDLLGLEGETVLTYDWEPVLKQRKEMLDAFGARIDLPLGIEFGMGFGYSKKESQQLAAKEAMRNIRKKTELYKQATEQYEIRTTTNSETSSESVEATA